MREELLQHAIDLAILGDWEGSKHCLMSLDDPAASRLIALLTQQQERESQDARVHAVAQHELGNALSIAQANVEGMLDGVLDATPERLNGIRDALQTAAVLLSDLKQVDKPAVASNNIDVSVFNVCDLIAAQVSMIRGVAESKNVFVGYEPCGLAHAACINYRGDAVRTGQILRNVLLNAVRYTPPGGRINVLCYRPDGELTLTISDSGPGIGDDEAPHVFEPGFRGRGAAGADGQGLGLSVVSKLLQALGGEARIVNQTREGATFVIRPALSSWAVSALLILQLFLAIGSVAIAIMLFVALYGSREPVSQQTVSAKGYAIRRYWFGTVLAVAIAAFIITIPRFPYPSAATAGRHFTVVAQQYAFSLPNVVPANTPVVFDVTSRDVNHGFAIYDPQERLVGQVQAMPDYVNHLPFRFSTRGHYTVRCLEYCGIAHASMQGGFDVR